MQQLTKKLNQVLAVMLTIVALLTGQQAWAQNPATIGSISYNSTLGAYEIANENNLKDLAVYVNGLGNYSTGGDEETTAHDCEGLTFKVTGNIALSNTTEWNVANEDAYTPIGTSSALFRGTFDGQGNTISGMRIYKTSTPANLNLGLFGYVGEGGTVKNINLSDVRISGYNRLGGVVGTNILGTVSGCRIANAFIDGKDSMGGIVGENRGTVSDCHTAETVTINANTNYAINLGGIVGSLGGYDATNVASIIGCTSAVTLTIGAGVTGCKYFGGIVGKSIWYSKSGTTLNARVENCIAIGATVPEVKYSQSLLHGAVVGLPKGTTFINDYYLNCTIAGTPNATGVGYISQEGDNSGLNTIQSLHTVTLQAGFTASGGIAVGSDTYYAANSTVTLAGGSGYTVTKDGTNPVEGVTVHENAGVYTFTMPAANVTVSGPPDYAGLWHADADHDGSSEAKAYLITTAAGLNLLAGEVNTGNNQEGKFFKLGGNITYTHATDWNDASSTENNYIPIGSSQMPFKGTFDGQGNTISGIRIYKGGSSESDDSSLGLFGFIRSGTVKNVTLSDTRITGYRWIGSIAGDNYYSTIINCNVANNVCIHAVVSGAYGHGGIVGYNYSYNSSATISGCTSSVQMTLADGLTNVHIRGGIVGWNAQSFFNSPSVISDCLVIGATIMKNDGNNNNVGAIAGVNIGAGGSENTNPGTLTNNYYSNCTVGNATTTANTNVGVGSGSGPSDNTTNDGARGIGRITLGTDVSKSGGTTVTVGSTEYYYAGEDISLSHSDAPTGYTFSGYTAKDAANNDITATVISESTFTMPATDVTLNVAWRKLLTNTDIAVTIPAQTYSGSALTPAVTVTDGTTELTKGTDYTISPETCTNTGEHVITITGIGNYDGEVEKTFSIVPATVMVNNGIEDVPAATGDATITQDETGITLTLITPTGSTPPQTVSIPTSIEVDHVTIDRTFTAEKACTVYLPFSIDVSKVAGGTFNSFTNVDMTKDPWEVTYTALPNDGVIAANTPYIFLPNNSNGGKITVNNTDKITVGTGITSTPQTNGDWTFIGTYEHIKWTKDTTDPEYTAARDAEIGRIYGFAAEAVSGATIGEFVKVGNNVTIDPMRAYLKYSGVLAARSLENNGATMEMPSSMKVVIIGSNGETTEIGTITNNRETITNNQWYTLDGRKLEIKPTAKGLYIHNGRKEVVR